mgnify:CR=1 FL=1
MRGFHYSGCARVTLLCAAAVFGFCVICGHAADHKVLQPRRWILVHLRGIAAYDTVQLGTKGRVIKAFSHSGQETGFPVHSCVSLMRRQPDVLNESRRRGLYIQLLNGDMILAENPEFDGKGLTFFHGAWGRLRISSSDLHMLIRPDLYSPDAEADFTGLMLKNDDTTRGTICSLTQESIMIDMDGIGKIPVGGLENVSRAVFNIKNKISTGEGKAGSVQIELVTGEVISGIPVKGGDNIWLIKTGWNEKPIRVYGSYIRSVCFFQHVTFTSALDPDSSSNSWFDDPFSYNRDMSALGSPLRVGGYSASKGIGMYAGTLLTFDLSSIPKQPRLFCCLAGIDSGAFYPGAEVELFISVNGKQVKHAMLRAGKGIVPVIIPINTGARSLRIRSSGDRMGPVSDAVDLMWSSFIHDVE